MSGFNSVGFVLKKIGLSGQQLSVLTKSEGKIVAKARNLRHPQSISPGCCLLFRLIEKAGGVFIVVSSKLLYFPDFNEIQDICWLHHILELHYFFIPSGDPDKNNFNNLKQYIFLFEAAKNYGLPRTEIGLTCVLHFLCKTGFYGDEDIVRYGEIFETNFHQFFVEPNKFDIAKFKSALQNVSSYDKSLMRELILSCLKVHPNYDIFNTVNLSNQR
jgi:hypothetical protein